MKLPGHSFWPKHVSKEPLMSEKKVFLAVCTGSGLLRLSIQGRVPDIQWTCYCKKITKLRQKTSMKCDILGSIFRNVKNTGGQLRKEYWPDCKPESRNPIFLTASRCVRLEKCTRWCRCELSSGRVWTRDVLQVFGTCWQARSRPGKRRSLCPCHSPATSSEPWCRCERIPKPLRTL